MLCHDHLWIAMHMIHSDDHEWIHSVVFFFFFEFFFSLFVNLRACSFRGMFRIFLICVCGDRVIVASICDINCYFSLQILFGTAGGRDRKCGRCGLKIRAGESPIPAACSVDRPAPRPAGTDGRGLLPAPPLVRYCRLFQGIGL